MLSKGVSPEIKPETRRKFLHNSYFISNFNQNKKMPRQVRNWILYTDLKYFHGTQVKSQKCKSSWCQFFRASARLRRFMPFKECYRFFGVFLGKKCSGANNYVFCVSEQLNIFKALNKKCKRMFLNEYFQTV